MSKEKIILPAMSDQMTEAELLKWNIEEGSDVNKGDVIGEVLIIIPNRENVLLPLYAGENVSKVNFFSGFIQFYIHFFIV